MSYETLVSLFEEQARARGDAPFLRVKADGVYRDVSWRETADRVQALAAALARRGILAGDRVGILSENRQEWIEADLASLSLGAITVGLHAPLTPAQVREQWADAEPKVVFVSTAEQAEKLRTVRESLPSILHAFAFDPDAARGGLEPFPALLAESGESSAIERPSPDSVAAIIYTSGTTGESKGVMLTHANFVSNVLGMQREHGAPRVTLVMAVLPLTHVYARTVDLYWTMATGRTLALAENYDSLLQNLQEVRPHYVSLVPRFHEKFAALARHRAAQGEKDALRAIYGGEIVWVSSGGAALNPDVARFYFDAGVPVFQGYGLTETSPVISFSGEGRNRIGASGKLIEHVEVRIAEDGEILTRGPHVMKGYWRKPEATRLAIDSGGWFHTGDIGHLDDDGFLFITDRKKDLIVTSYGKNIAPQQVEGLLCFDPFIEQALVYGDARPFLTALIVPSREPLLHWAQTVGADTTDWETFARSSAVNQFLQERVKRALKDLSSEQQVRRIVSLPEPFSFERGEITLTAKLRRRNIVDRYRAELEALYDAPP